MTRMTNRKYEAPHLEEVGTLAELTQSNGQGGPYDGASYVIPPGAGLPGVPGFQPGNTVLLTGSKKA